MKKRKPEIINLSRGCTLVRYSILNIMKANRNNIF